MKKSQATSHMNRRKFIAAASAFSAATLVPGALSANPNRFSAKVDGLNLGVITYSFRSMPGSAKDLLKYVSELGLSSVELMSDPAEEFAGAPKRPKRKRGKMKDTEKAEREAWQKEMVKWRLSTSMDRFKLLRKKFNAEGINIEVVKFGQMARMSEGEINYCFDVAEALGAHAITLERSDKAVKKLTPFADKHQRLIGYHNHAKVNFNSWDKHLEASKYNAVNLDVGHYMAGTNSSAVPLIKKYHDRISNLHLKDRKKDNGPNMPWGEGDTPLGDILRLLQKENYSFMAAIELEYPIPEGSDAVKEVKKCIDFCKDAVS